MSCSEGFDGIGETHHSTGRMEQYGNNQPVDMSISNEAVHSDAVMSLSSVQPGVCVSGSKDKVGSIMIFFSNFLLDKIFLHLRFHRLCYIV